MSNGLRLLLAFDFGLKRIGIATANLLTRTASPLTTLRTPSPGTPPWPAIDGLIAEWQPDLLVVGHPGPDAAAGIPEAIDTFIKDLGERYTRPVAQVDESFSSAAAESELRAGRREGIYNRRLDRTRIDAHAACLIAEQWMNQTLERD